MKAKIAVCASLFLFLLIASANAAINQQSINDNAAAMQNILGQSGAAYIAILISLLIAAVLYMGSSVFSDSRMLAISKDTFYQALMSLLLIASFPVIYVVVTQLCVELFLGGMPVSGDVYDIGKMFLLWNQIYYGVHLLIITILYGGISGIINQQYTIPVASALVNINLTAFAKPMLFAMNMGITLITTSLFVNTFQLMFLDIVHTNLLPIFLPLGVLLRAFPGTLNAGNVLLAIAIGSYIIVPAVYMFDIYLVRELVSDKNLNPPPNTNAPDFKNGLGLMPFFYNQQTLSTIVSAGANCPLAKKFLNMGTNGYAGPYEVLAMSYNDYNNSLAGCGVFLDAIPTQLSKLPTWAVVALGTATAASAASSIITAATTLRDVSPTIWARLCAKKGLGTACKFASQFAFGLSAFSALSMGALAIFLFVMAFDLISGTAVSFIILAVIIPFINFTIVVIFIRDFSQYVLGTPISLGHLVRLI